MQIPRQVELHEKFDFLLTDRKADAKKLVDEVLKQKPEHEAAKKLNEQLK